MSKSLIQIFPQPTLLVMDDQEFFIEPLKLKDIAYLEHYLTSVFPHPFALKREEYFAALEDDQQQNILRECYEAAKDYQCPSIDNSHFDTPKGRMVFLSLVLKNLSTERLFEILTKSYTDIEVYKQFQALVRIAYEIEPDKELDFLIGALTARSDDDGEVVDVWSEKVCEVAQRYGWTLEQVSYLTMTQFLLAWRSGEVVTKSFVTDSLQEAAAEARRRREALGYKSGSNGVCNGMEGPGGSQCP